MRVRDTMKGYCKQCGKKLSDDKIMYGALYCRDKCKRLFNAKRNKRSAHKLWIIRRMYPT